KRITPVHRTAVIPQYEIANLPFAVPHKGFLRGIHPKLIEQRVRFRKCQPLDVRVTPPTEVQKATPGFGMRANQRMIVTRRMDRVIDCGCTLPDISTAVVCSIVLQCETFNPAPEFFRQGLIRTIHAAEIGIAAFTRDYEGIKDTRPGWMLEIRHVGMPACFTSAKAANRFSIFNHVRNNIDFWMTLHETSASLLYRRPVEFTKTLTERDQVFISQLLPLKQQNLMIEPGAVNGLKLIRQKIFKIDVQNHGPKRFSGRDDLHYENRASTDPKAPKSMRT